MRRLLSGRATTAALVGVAMVLAAGGGYAVARGSGSDTITVCVHQHSHALYLGRCAKHDRKLSWNRIGPPGPTGPSGSHGPGATKLVYDASGSQTPRTTTIGAMGPYVVSARCSQPSAGKTTLDIFVSGPAGRLDGIGDGGTSLSGVFATADNMNLFGTITSTATTGTTVADSVLWIPTSGQSVQTLLTGQAAGGAMNSCHFSAAVMPVG